MNPPALDKSRLVRMGDPSQHRSRSNGVHHGRDTENHVNNRDRPKLSYVCRSMTLGIKVTTL